MSKANRKRRPDELPEIFVTLKQASHPGFLRCTQAEAELIDKLLNSRVRDINANAAPGGSWVIAVTFDLELATARLRPCLPSLFGHLGRPLREVLSKLAALENPVPNPRPKRAGLLSRIARRLRPTRKETR